MLYEHAYQSFGAFCEAANVPPVNAHNFQEWEKHRDGRRMRDDWYGSAAPLSEVIRFLRAGWPEGVAAMREELGAIKLPVVRSVRRKQVWAGQGDSVDMGRVYSGALDQAFRTTRKAPVGRATHVRFVLNWAAPQSTNKGQMFYRGAVISALVEALTEAGYQTAVSVVKKVTKVTEFDDTLLAVHLKHYTEPLALAPLVALTAHAAAYRRVGFAWTYATVPEAVHSNMGVPVTTLTLADVQHLIPSEPHARAIFVPSEIHSRAEAQAFVTTMLHEIEGKGALV